MSTQNKDDIESIVIPTIRSERFLLSDKHITVAVP